MQYVGLVEDFCESVNVPVLNGRQLASANTNQNALFDSGHKCCGAVFKYCTAGTAYNHLV